MSFWVYLLRCADGSYYTGHTDKVVDDQAVSLLLGVRSVHPADGLQQRMVAQRLVEIHRLENRRIEAGQ